MKDITDVFHISRLIENVGILPTITNKGGDMSKEQLALYVGALLLLASLLLNWRARSSDMKFFSWLANTIGFSLLAFAGASKVDLVDFFRRQNFLPPFIVILCILAGLLAIPTGMAIRGLRSKLIRTPG